MYIPEESGQFELVDFILPFGGSLDSKNRFMKLAKIMPWDYIEEVYLQTMSQENGRRAINSRIAFGVIFIKKLENISDERTVQSIRKTRICSTSLVCTNFSQNHCLTVP